MKTRLLLAALMILTITACKKKDDSTDNKTAASIKGTWTVSSVSDYTLKINDDNTYSYLGAGVTMESGTYTSDASSISFTATSGMLCPTDVAAKYNFSVSDTDLTFSNVDDNCTYRTAILNLGFKRQ